MSRGIALAAWCGLVLLQPAWHVFWHPAVALPPALAALLMSLPLLPVLVALVRGGRRAHVWGGFVGVFYFMHGIVVAMTNATARAAGLLEIGLTLVFFSSALVLLRR